MTSKNTESADEIEDGDDLDLGFDYARIRVAIQDPKAADGETIQADYAITDRELEELLDRDEYVRMIINHMGTSVARKWDAERSDAEPDDL